MVFVVLQILQMLKRVISLRSSWGTTYSFPLGHDVGKQLKKIAPMVGKMSEPSHHEHVVKYNAIEDKDENND